MNSICRLMLCASIVVTSLHAQAKTVSEALNQCSTEENALKRLVCYDRLVKDMQQYDGLDASASAGLPGIMRAPSVQAGNVSAAVQSASGQNAATSPEPKQDPVSDFGLQKTVAAEVDRIVAEVAKVTKTSRKKWIITFTDGQVWRQSDSVSLRLKAGDKVYVARGALGSFFLGKEGANKRIRVKREK